VIIRNDAFERLGDGGLKPVLTRLFSPGIAAGRTVVLAMSRGYGEVVRQM